MTELATARGFTDETFQAFLSTRQEPDWLVDQRQQAWQQFSALGWPTANDEQWRRTDIRLFKADRYHPPLETAAPSIPESSPLLTAGVTLAGHTVAVDSIPATSQLDEKYAKQGVLFGSLDQLLPEHEALLRPYWNKAFDPSYDRFSALHSAFWSGGTLLYVPRGVRIEQPLHTLSVLSGGSDLGHQLVILEEGAEATLLAECVGGNSGWHCGAIELQVGSNAQLRYVNLQNWDDTVWHFAQQQGRVERNGRLQWTIGALGSRLAKVNQNVSLCGEDAEVQVNGVMFTEGRQHLSYHTLQHHAAPHCRSDLLYKGGLQDHSRIVWRGMIQVDPGADGTNGYQRNDNLLLSEQSRCDSIPGLEILADDVKCTHAATTGRVDDELIFYAQSRGLTRKEATRMIVAGFFQQVFDRITIESVREALGEAIGRRVREYQ